MQNIISAFSSLWHNKVRSILTLLGVVIGVASVATLVSLGQGLKNDVSHLIQGFGTNVIVVIGGKLQTTSGGAQASQGINPANFISGDVLTMKDVQAAQSMADVEQVTPMSVVAGSVKYQDKIDQPTLIGVYPNALQAFTVLQLQQGQMFTQNRADHVIVLGQQAKDALFGNQPAIGQDVSIAGIPFSVVGILDKPKGSSIFGSEFDTVSLIPFDSATELNKNQVKILRIIVKASDNANVTAVKNQLHNTILKQHNGEENFSVLTQDDLLGLFDQFLGLATALVSAIAAISLVVGGIGIMNIMLVTVTERTREIGLRKAVGATSLDIMGQFLTESVILTLLGGLIGLGIAFGIGLLVKAHTPLSPALTWQVVALAVGLSMIEGAVFGLWPAIRAARKPPIEALRYE